jgi:phosphopantetheine--protein transferase-like protein
MIIGIGIDLVDITRIKVIISKWDVHFLHKIYTSPEIKYCDSKNKNRFQSYAGLFAAKEAFVKALGTGFRYIKWKEIEIKKDNLDKPIICLSGKASEIVSKRRITAINLSISHTKQLAIAQVIIEG